MSRKDLLSLDFEGLMKYFRVNIPKRYRSEDHAKYLMEIAMVIKLKRLNKYEKEWASIKAAERAREDPVVRLERENKKLLGDNMRLDTENDNLARQLVNSKIEMRKDIDAAEDAKDIFEKDLSAAKGPCTHDVHKMFYQPFVELTFYSPPCSVTQRGRHMCVPLAGSAGGGRRGEEAVAGRERDAEGADEEGGGPPRL